MVLSSLIVQATLRLDSPEFGTFPFAGGIAQLGERLHGMQEVSGSIPLTSTSDPHGYVG